MEDDSISLIKIPSTITETTASVNESQGKVSYKDTLTQGVFSSFINGHTQSDFLVGNAINQTSCGPSSDGEVINVTLSHLDKERLAKRWAQSLIIKVYGKRVGFKFLSQKLLQLWKHLKFPAMIDLGEDFFLLKFEREADYNFVLKKGPWFVSGHFLTVRKWEPNFKASEATFSSVAVWVRLMELPVELFDGEILMAIGNSIGKLIKIDSRTLGGERGRYARLCIQINMNKPLVKSVRIENTNYPIMYEGLGSLCFYCGRVGQKEENCPEKIPATAEANNSIIEKEKDNFGPWMMVQNRKNRKVNKKGNPSTSALQKQTLLVDGDVSKSVNKASKSGLISNKASTQHFEPSQNKDTKVRDIKKGKAISIDKNIPAKNSWPPKTSEKGESSNLNNKLNSIVEPPLPSSTPESNSSPKRNPVSISMKEFEFLPCDQSQGSYQMGSNFQFSPNLQVTNLEFLCNPITKNAIPSIPLENLPKDATEATTSPPQEESSSPYSPSGTPVDSPTTGTIGFRGEPTDTGATEVALAGILNEPAFCLQSSEEGGTASLDSDSGGGTREQYSYAHHPEGFPDGSQTENNSVMGESVEGSVLGDPNLDADHGGVLPACRSPRVPTRQQQDDSLQDRSQSQCKSFPRLRKILEDARGTGQKNAQVGCILSSDTPTGGSGMAPSVRGRKSKAKPASKQKPKNRNVDDCLEL